MDIPVDDQHAFEAVGRLGVTGRERHVVEQAESHPLRRSGVVARGTDDREGVCHAACADRVDREQEPPGGAAGCVERRFPLDRRVTGGEDDEAVGDILCHDPQVIRRVDAEQLGIGDRPRRQRHASFKEAVGLEPIEDRRHSLGTLRVPRAGVMEERGGIGHKTSHRRGPDGCGERNDRPIVAPTGPPRGVDGPPGTERRGGWGGWAERERGNLPENSPVARWSWVPAAPRYTARPGRIQIQRRLRPWQWRFG